MPPSHDPAIDFPTSSVDTLQPQGRIPAHGTPTPTPRHPTTVSNQNPRQRHEEHTREAAKQQARTNYTLPFLARQGPFTPSAFEHPAEYYVNAADQRQQRANAGLDSKSGQKQYRKSRSSVEAGESGNTSAIPRNLRPGPPKAKPAMPKSILKNRIVTPAASPSSAKPPPQTFQASTVTTTNHPGGRYPPQPTARSPSQEVLIANTADIHPCPSTRQSYPDASSSSSSPERKQQSGPTSSSASAARTNRTSVNSTPTKAPFPHSTGKNVAHETPFNPETNPPSRPTPPTHSLANTNPDTRLTRLHTRHNKTSSDYRKALAAHHHHEPLSTQLAQNATDLPCAHNVPPSPSNVPPPAPPSNHNHSESTASPSILPHKEWPWLEPHELHQPKRLTRLAIWGRKVRKFVKNGLRRVREDHGRKMKPNLRPPGGERGWVDG
ncbi:hypothetical protein CERZMDRAFT_100777 [Cercospora zeae-maydis SCOH1-5]|uniref:Uncharacterized protein n=1 Tax=Cercospora zeae-maydis SCOH1-5 TaxID=717836 RepID=A0A6A6F736_9PEZI|nr:hypothetical protein CERZMDRAFT_100777 [Cercospora zeae-maydis SCOH1-5]